MAGAVNQLGLPFPYVPRYGSFLPAESNAEARAWLARPQDWPQGRIGIWGEAGCGKTHLLHLWAGTRPVLDGAMLDGAGLGAEIWPAYLAVDNADRVPNPRNLLHLLNSCAEAGCLVVLAGRTPPARWHTGLPDLDSRLRALAAVAIGAPEDSLLEALLRQLLAERQLAVAKPLQDWLRLRLPRTAQAMREAASALDQASLAAGQAVTRQLAAEVLAHFAKSEDFSTQPNPLSPDDQGLM
jgi:chromosomal replication initiation ATPase DnaA